MSREGALKQEKKPLISSEEEAAVMAYGDKLGFSYVDTGRFGKHFERQTEKGGTQHTTLQEMQKEMKTKERQQAYREEQEEKGAA